MVHVVPIPVHASTAPGRPAARLGPDSRIVADRAIADTASTAADVLAPALGGRPRLVGPDVPGADGDIRLRLTPGVADAPPTTRSPSGAEEGYALRAAAGVVEVAAPHPAGLLAGAQTLRQLVAAAGGQLDELTVTDAPRYPYRGLMLDLTRIDAATTVAEAVLPVMAGLKLNVLRLQLATERRWLVDLPSRPRLAAEADAAGAAVRAADLERIAAAAARHHITVVPGIELPGSAGPAIDAYPELGGTTGRTGTLDVGSAASRGFVRDVVRDLAEMTVGPFLQLGGERGTSGPGPYARFMAEATAAVHAAGKTTIAAADAGGGALAPGTIGRWSGRTDAPSGDLDRARTFADGGGIVLAPADRSPIDDAGRVRSAYGWEPGGIVPGVAATSVLGIEAVLAPERAPSEAELAAALHAGGAAIAELAWSPEPGLRVPERTVERFLERLDGVAVALAAIG